MVLDPPLSIVPLLLGTLMIVGNGMIEPIPVPDEVTIALVGTGPNVEFDIVNEDSEPGIGSVLKLIEPVGETPESIVDRMVPEGPSIVVKLAVGNGGGINSEAVGSVLVNVTVRVVVSDPVSDEGGIPVLVPEPIAVDELIEGSGKGTLGELGNGGGNERLIVVLVEVVLLRSVVNGMLVAVPPLVEFSEGRGNGAVSEPAIVLRVGPVTSEEGITLVPVEVPKNEEEFVPGKGKGAVTDPAAVVGGEMTADDEIKPVPVEPMITDELTDGTGKGTDCELVGGMGTIPVPVSLLITVELIVGKGKGTVNESATVPETLAVEESVPGIGAPLVGNDSVVVLLPGNGGGSVLENGSESVSDPEALTEDTEILVETAVERETVSVLAVVLPEFPKGEEAEVEGSIVADRLEVVVSVTPMVDSDPETVTTVRAVTDPETVVVITVPPGGRLGPAVLVNTADELLLGATVMTPVKVSGKSDRVSVPPCVTVRVVLGSVAEEDALEESEEMERLEEALLLLLAETLVTVLLEGGLPVTASVWENPDITLVVIVVVIEMPEEIVMIVTVSRVTDPSTVVDDPDRSDEVRVPELSLLLLPLLGEESPDALAVCWP